jgi:hypothetical protein
MGLKVVTTANGLPAKQMGTSSSVQNVTMTFMTGNPIGRRNGMTLTLIVKKRGASPLFLLDGLMLQKQRLTGAGAVIRVLLNDYKDLRRF